jgi:hypothetical protein
MRENAMHSGRTFRAVSLAALTMLAAAPIAQAQGLDSDQAIDTIVGSEVDEQETRSVAAIDDVLSAIDKTVETTGRVRKVTTLDTVDIVFLSDAAQAEGGPPPQIEASIAAHQDEIAELRKELEGNAMLFHAVDSRNVLMRDIIAVAFSDDSKVTIYAATKPPS